MNDIRRDNFISIFSDKKSNNVNIWNPTGTYAVGLFTEDDTLPINISYNFYVSSSVEQLVTLGIQYIYYTEEGQAIQLRYQREHLRANKVHTFNGHFSMVIPRGYYLAFKIYAYDISAVTLSNNWQESNIYTN